jgi:broad specificity phosphatase PhoE
VNRLLLVRHSTSGQTRRAAFPSTSGAAPVDGCEPLDAAGRRAAAALAGLLPPADRCWASLAVRARQTAELACGPPAPDPDLAECDFGAWAGLTLAEVGDKDPAGLAAWWADPDAAPHGGERLAQVRRRAGGVLDRAAAAGGTTIAFTHGGLIKAALLEVLGLPAAGLWRLDAAPASVTELRQGPGARAAHAPGDGRGQQSNGRWRLTRLNWVPVLTGVGS